METRRLKKVSFFKGRLTLPGGYRSHLNLIETEEAIEYIKAFFQKQLAKELNLTRVSAPLVVLGRTGINDHLTGIEKPISFFCKKHERKSRDYTISGQMEKNSSC